jgi:hypothetical protein
LEFDVEPWATAGWPANAPSALDGYVRMVERVSKAARRSPAMPAVMFAVPYWLDGTNPAAVINHGARRASALEHVARALRTTPGAGIVVMSYVTRTTGAGSVTNVTARAAQRAQRVAPKLRITVALDTTGHDPDAPAFSDRDAARFAADVRTIERSLRGTPHFAGVVVNDVDGLHHVTGAS